MSDNLLDDETPSFGQQKARIGQIMAYLWGHWSSQPGYLTIVTILMIVSSACELALPSLSGRIVEAFSQGPQAADVAFGVFGIFASVAAGQFFARNIMVRFWSTFAARNMKAITVNSFADVQRFSSQWHADNFAGATVRRISRAMWAYDTLSDNFLWFILPAAIVLIGLTGMMWAQWPLIGAYVGGSILLFATASILLAKYYIQDANEKSNTADTAIGAALADAVSANPSVKAFGAESRELARFAGVVENWRHLVRNTWFRYSDGWLVSNAVLWGLQVGLLGLVLIEWREGRASAGDATFALTSYFLIASYLRNLGETVQQIQRGFADIEDAVAYSLEKEDVADKADARDFNKGAGEIVFDRVNFGYKGQSAQLYENFSLTIAPGEIVALVGKTGSGKSTFVKLLQRLFDVDAGAIRIDGQDVRDVSQSSLRSAIALVPQDPALFHRSLRENIAYARAEASDADVLSAAKYAKASDFIDGLPNGFQTLVGERGVKLSGGERQRVALARAFLSNARILVLDEATSSLDTQTERDVQVAMKDLAKDRTTILIAHRLSTIRDANRILVFDEGRVVEQGNHRELIKLGGVYARLNALSVGDGLVE